VYFGNEDILAQRLAGAQDRSPGIDDSGRAERNSIRRAAATSARTIIASLSLARATSTALVSATTSARPGADCCCSPPTSLFNGRLGYRFDNGWRIQLDALNLLNTETNQITYAYGSLIKTDQPVRSVPLGDAPAHGGGWRWSLPGADAAR
jgi:hypothetical protein